MALNVANFTSQPLMANFQMDMAESGHNPRILPTTTSFAITSSVAIMTMAMLVEWMAYTGLDPELRIDDNRGRIPRKRFRKNGRKKKHRRRKKKGKRNKKPKFSNEENNEDEEIFPIIEEIEYQDFPNENNFRQNLYPQINQIVSEIQDEKPFDKGEKFTAKDILYFPSPEIELDLNKGVLNKNYRPDFKKIEKPFNKYHEKYFTNDNDDHEHPLSHPSLHYRPGFKTKVDNKNQNIFYIDNDEEDNIEFIDYDHFNNNNEDDFNYIAPDVDSSRPIKPFVPMDKKEILDINYDSFNSYVKPPSNIVFNNPKPDPDYFDSISDDFKDFKFSDHSVNSYQDSNTQIFENNDDHSLNQFNDFQDNQQTRNIAESPVIDYINSKNIPSFPKPNKERNFDELNFSGEFKKFENEFNSNGDKINKSIRDYKLRRNPFRTSDEKFDEYEGISDSIRSKSRFNSNSKFELNQENLKPLVDESNKRRKTNNEFENLINESVKLNNFTQNVEDVIEKVKTPIKNNRKKARILNPTEIFADKDPELKSYINEVVGGDIYKTDTQISRSSNENNNEKRQNINNNYSKFPNFPPKDINDIYKSTNRVANRRNSGHKLRDIIFNETQSNKKSESKNNKNVSNLIIKNGGYNIEALAKVMEYTNTQFNNDQSKKPESSLKSRQRLSSSTLVDYSKDSHEKINSLDEISERFVKNYISQRFASYASTQKVSEMEKFVLAKLQKEKNLINSENIVTKIEKIIRSYRKEGQKRNQIRGKVRIKRDDNSENSNKEIIKIVNAEDDDSESVHKIMHKFMNDNEEILKRVLERKNIYDIFANYPNEMSSEEDILKAVEKMGQEEYSLDEFNPILTANKFHQNDGWNPNLVSNRFNSPFIEPLTRPLNREASTTPIPPTTSSTTTTSTTTVTTTNTPIPSLLSTDNSELGDGENSLIKSIPIVGDMVTALSEGESNGPIYAMIAGLGVVGLIVGANIAESQIFSNNRRSDSGNDLRRSNSRNNQKKRRRRRKKKKKQPKRPVYNTKNNYDDYYDDDDYRDNGNDNIYDYIEYSEYDLSPELEKLLADIDLKDLDYYSYDLNNYDSYSSNYDQKRKSVTQRRGQSPSTTNYKREPTRKGSKRRNYNSNNPKRDYTNSNTWYSSTSSSFFSR